MATSTEDAIREEVVAWLRANLPADWIEGIENNDPTKLAEGRKQVDYNEWCEKLGKAGYATPSWPKEYGGGGFDPDGVRAVNETLGKYKVPMPNQGLNEDEIKEFISYFRWVDENVQPKGTTQPQGAAPGKALPPSGTPSGKPGGGSGA